MLIDTHCHLNFSDFGADLEAVVKNAQEAGVGKIICASSNIADSREAIEIAKKFPGVVFASVGIHPQKTDPENNDSAERQIKELSLLAMEKSVVAIGECGLDYTVSAKASPVKSFQDFTLPPPGEIERTKEDQIYLFEEQIELALKLDLPVIIHSRKAFDDTIEILRKYLDGSKIAALPAVARNDRILRGVLHCYSGGKSDIKKVEELGFYFGIDGNVTYDQGLQNIVKLIPQDRLLIETDAPFLTPVPYRGLRNEPKNAKIIATFVASLLAIPQGDFESIIERNTKRLFNVE